MDDSQPTDRQLRMLSLAARGFSRREIGVELCVSQWTVKMDLDAIRLLVGARNVAHAITLCLVTGWLFIDGAGIAVARRRHLAAA